MGGLWEFPGGKINSGEASSAALKRELHEELNMEVESASPLVQIDHDYPNIKVKLDVWVVNAWRGDIYGKEGQELEWAWTNRLREKKFPAANIGIISAITLSRLYLITPDLEYYDESFINKSRILIENGVKLFQFRSRKNALSSNLKVVEELITICNKNNCLFIYNGKPEEASAVGAHGVHLSSVDLLHYAGRPLSDHFWIAASCHNQMEVRHAADIGIDFCVLSPIRETTSHVTGEPLGWEKFSNIAREFDIPLYALGGVYPSELDMALRSGARGIAMISGVWNADDPVMAVRACMRET